MGTKFSRLTDSINRRQRRSCTSGDDVIHGSHQARNGSLETGHDPAIHGAKLEDRNYNNEAFKKRTIDSSDPQQNQAALAIQTQFRQHSAKQEVTAMKEELAATRIQAGVRGYLDREQVREMKTKKDEGETKEIDIDLGDPDVEKAAVKIQAGFKGYKARKEIQDQAGESTEAKEETEAPAADTSPTDAGETQAAQEEEIDIDLNDPNTEKAAVKIQAGFRGYQTRKDLTKQQPDGQAQTATTDVQPATKEPSQAPSTSEQESISKAAKGQEEGEEIDIDLTDPEVEKAATKIQAGFKGFKARKEVQAQKDDGVEAPSDQVDAAPEVVPPADAPAETTLAPEGEDQTDQAAPEEVASQEEATPDAGGQEAEDEADSAPAQQGDSVEVAAEEIAPDAKEQGGD